MRERALAYACQPVWKFNGQKGRATLKRTGFNYCRVQEQDKLCPRITLGDPPPSTGSAESVRAFCHWQRNKHVRPSSQNHLPVQVCTWYHIDTDAYLAWLRTL